MANLFEKIKLKKPKRSLFDLSHEVKLTTEMGRLTPFMCVPVLPGDSFQVQSQILTRMMPMISPVMHQVNIYTHFFFVPNRIIWDNWENFITGGELGDLNVPFPTLHFGDDPSDYKFLSQSSLADYLGLPTLPKDLQFDRVSLDYKVNALPFRAYQLIYNEFYRDQNLTESVDIMKDADGDLPATKVPELLKLRTRAWEKDYFTSALPWPQRGPEVRMPLEDANVKFNTDGLPFSGSGVPRYWRNSADHLNVPNGPLKTNISGQPVVEYNGSDIGALYNPGDTLKADMSGVGPSVRELRRQVRLQEFLERDAIGGSRLKEFIYSHFGVMNNDGRLQRPEYLGGGKSPIVISEVLQTSSSDGETPQGNMAGHGASVGVTHKFRKFFTEHGFVIGIMSIIPRSSYQDGVPREFKKFDRFDYAFPEFAHIGEQEITQDELAVNYDVEGTDNNNLVFGYAPRYSEYKYIPSQVKGQFRQDLSFWHLGRMFDRYSNQGDPIGLNTQFVEAQPINRIFAYENSDQDHYLVQIFNDFKAKRCLPYFGTPMF